MSKPVAVPNTFATQAGPIPLSQLDADFTAGLNALNDLSTYSNFFLDTGAVNAMAITVTLPLTFGLTAGVRLQVVVGNTNTLTAVTLAVNGGASTTVLLNGGSPPPVGSLAAGAIMDVQYNGTNWLVLNVGSSGAGISVASVNVTGAVAPANGEYLPAANTWGVSTNSTQRITVNGTGNVVIAAPSAGIAVTINGFNGVHSTKISDSATNLFNAGFLEMPASGIAGGFPYTTVLSDSGKFIANTTGGAVTATIAANASVAYPIGTVLSFINDASAAVNMTIAINSDTLVYSPTGGTGSRTLSQFGKASAVKTATTRWYISGSGIS